MNIHPFSHEGYCSVNEIFTNGKLRNVHVVCCEFYEMSFLFRRNNKQNIPFVIFENFLGDAFNFAKELGV